MPIEVSERIGQVLDERYRLSARIGTGASAEVYTADDLRLHRTVAIKILHPDLAADGRVRRRFRTEARTTAQLQHPNLVAVFDWSEVASVAEDGTQSPVYLVSEYLRGGSVRSVLDRNGPLSHSQVLLVGLDVARGLASAHRQGLVHRDIKPANLLLDTEGRVRIADFGIARAVAEAAGTDEEAGRLGTARYAAPEQARRVDVDGRADVYALAVTMVELATGTVPLAGSTPLETVTIRQATDLEIPEELGVLRPVLQQAGRVDPEQRPSAAELVDALLALAPALPRPEPLVAPDQPTRGCEPSEAVLVVGPSTSTIELGDERSPGPETRPLVTGVVAGSPTVPLSEPEPNGASNQADSDEIEGDSTAPLDHPESGRSRRGRGRIGWMVIAALLLVAGGIVWQQWSSTSVADAVQPPATGIVGNYVGRVADEAVADIGVRGWDVATEMGREDGFAPGTVITQSPLPGAEVEEPVTVRLVISEGFRLHQVPALEGIAETEAVTALTENELTLGEVDRQFSETVEVDTVISASVEAGSERETGTPIDLVVSLGPQPRTIEDFAGQPEDYAISALEAVGLTPIADGEYSTSVPEGQVIATDPAVGAEVPRGSEVHVIVSLGLPFVDVPDVTGQNAADAADVLESEGLTVIDTVGPPNAEVLATSPPAGESVRVGTDVVVFTRQ